MNVERSTKPTYLCITLPSSTRLPRLIFTTWKSFHSCSHRNPSKMALLLLVLEQCMPTASCDSPITWTSTSGKGTMAKQLADESKSSSYRSSGSPSAVDDLSLLFLSPLPSLSVCHSLPLSFCHFCCSVFVLS